MDYKENLSVLEYKASVANLLETNMKSTAKCNLGARLTHFEVLMVLSSVCSTETVQVVGRQDLALGDLAQGKSQNSATTERGLTGSPRLVLYLFFSKD